jgi:uncharacterized protein (DUF427 family)
LLRQLGAIADEAADSLFGASGAAGCGSHARWSYPTAMTSAHTQPTRGTRHRLEDIVDRVQNTNIEHLMFEPTAKRVRTILNGVTVADSTNVMIMHEPGRLAVYYFPIEDVRRDLLIPSPKRTSSPLKGEAQYWSIQVGATIAQDAAGRQAIRRHPAGVPWLR